MGRSHPIKRSPDRLRSQTSPGITEHRPNIFRAFPGISGHRRTRNDHRVPCRPSPVTPSRMARRGGIARRRIACDQARRLRYRRSPVTASGMVVACRIVRRRIVCRRARRPITCRHVPARVGDLMSLRWSRSGAPNARHLPCPGPTYACRRRRQPLCCEHIFACTPWRFITARPAARLRRIVGPLASRHTVPNRPGSRRDRASPRINGYNRT